ncbi:MAG: CDF family Co(II)/Ni(II) efflux transporter DmeF [Hyphomonadaceae bacterium]
MHTCDTSHWRHEHVFGLNKPKPAERRTLIVVLLTFTAMVIEIGAGLAFGSMALLADGLHMGSHAVALGIAFVAYVAARRYAGDARFSFGTGKINALAGFAGALLLAVFAAGVAWESITRIVQPTEIAYTQAISVAVVGLIVNLICAVILLGGHDHTHADHAHSHGEHDHDHHHDHAGTDHNLRSAYLHVLADALTSVLAIVALTGGLLFSAGWLDPAMGIVGAILIARWSWDLIGSSALVLLDWQAPEPVQRRIRKALEIGDDRVVDLHVWSVGPGFRAAAISLVSHAPRTPDIYKSRIPEDLGVVHLTVEVHRCWSALAAA